jgi:hypothetical protein
MTRVARPGAGVVVPPQEPPGDRTIDAISDGVRHFLVVLLIAVVALWLAPSVMDAAESTVRQRPHMAAGWGVLAFVGYIVSPRPDLDHVLHP